MSHSPAQSLVLEALSRSPRAYLLERTVQTNNGIVSDFTWVDLPGSGPKVRTGTVDALMRKGALAVETVAPGWYEYRLAATKYGCSYPGCGWSSAGVWTVNTACLTHGKAKAPRPEGRGAR